MIQPGWGRPAQTVPVSIVISFGCINLLKQSTYLLCESHQAIEWSTTAREVYALSGGSAEGVGGQGQSRNGNIICDDSSANLSGSVGDVKHLSGVDEGAARCRSKEIVGPLHQQFNDHFRR